MLQSGMEGFSVRGGSQFFRGVRTLEDTMYVLFLYFGCNIRQEGHPCF